MVTMTLQNLEFTRRRLMMTGFTPASISLANSSSVLHADLSALHHYTQHENVSHEFVNFYCRMWYFYFSFVASSSVWIQVCLPFLLSFSSLLPFGEHLLLNGSLEWEENRWKKKAHSKNFLQMVFSTFSPHQIGFCWKLNWDLGAMCTGTWGSNPTQTPLALLDVFFTLGYQLVILFSIISGQLHRNSKLPILELDLD